jgi:hypothetical protein
LNHILSKSFLPIIQVLKEIEFKGYYG